MAQWYQGTIKTLQDMIRDTRQQRFIKESPQYKLAVEKLFQAKETFGRQQAVQDALIKAKTPKEVLDILRYVDPEGFLKTAGEQFGETPKGQADIKATQALTGQRIQVKKTGIERERYYKARTETPEKFRSTPIRVKTAKEREITRIITKRDKGETLTKIEQRYLDDYFLKKESETDELLKMILGGNLNNQGPLDDVLPEEYR